MTDRERSGDPGGDDYDVAIVGGGPAGCSAAVFTARYGLDTVVFDRGNAALTRCAFLQNYLGFPAGIGVGRFQELMHAHLEEAGAELVPETVVSVEEATKAEGFAVETREGRAIEVDSVVAAAWYDGSYLRGLDDGEKLFETHRHHGEERERFDPNYPDDDGRTPVEGLYVASPAGGRSAQAIVAAGNGAHVARCLLADRRRERGYSGGVAPHYDWLRPDSEFSGEWADRDRWREWFENEFDGADDVDDDRLAELREAYIDRAFATRLSDEEVRDRAQNGLRRLVDVVGHERVLAAVGRTAALDAIDDDLIREYLDDGEAVETSD